ncbi:MAG: transcription termination factor Rho [Lentisphaeraceae bacterium]|nr:transcription termination factor Rho [Lentisphaeraceae bacterium]
MSDTIKVSGFLEKHQKGFGFLRSLENSFNKSDSDTFVPAGAIKKFFLEDGVFVEGEAIINPGKPAPSLKEVTALNGVKPENFRTRKSFAKGDAITPHEWLQLEMPGGSPSNRIVDIAAPIGKGQRALIVAPPRSGKTVLLENMITATTKKFTDITTIIMLIDERPEEVTHFKRTFPDSIILASSNDQEPTEHMNLARKTFAAVKSMVEQGKDVIIFMDSLTRLCRAYNSQQRGGRTLSGGLDTNALVEPKKMFGMARKIENGGSLTIVATTLVNTGSAMDDVIFREFKGTGNMELVLESDLANRQLYPAVNIAESGTRNDHKIFGYEVADQVNSLRGALSDCKKEEALRQVLSLVKKYPTNDDFLKLQD